jgi:fluoride exporter
VGGTIGIWQQVLLVAIGGATGSVARFGVGIFALKRFGARFPYGTCFVNLTGCFLIGVLAALFAARTLPASQQLRLAIITGFLGGYTTFSSYALDTSNLTAEGEWWLAFVNFVGTAVVGFIALRLGTALARVAF